MFSARVAKIKRDLLSDPSDLRTVSLAGRVIAFPCTVRLVVPGLPVPARVVVLPDSDIS